MTIYTSYAYCNLSVDTVNKVCKYMYMNPDLNIRLSISEAAKLLKISKDTLRRWERNGFIKPLRTPTNRRVYNKLQLISVYNTHNRVKHIKAIHNSKNIKINKRKLITSSLIFLLIVDLFLVTLYLLRR